MTRLYLSFLVSLCLLTISQRLIAQEAQTIFEQIFHESTDFIVELLSSANTTCKERVIHPFLQNTKLGAISSECFRIIFEGDIRDVRQQTLPEFMERMQYVQSESIDKATEWLDNIAQNTTQEEFDQMQQDFEYLQAEWHTCSKSPHNSF